MSNSIMNNNNINKLQKCDQHIIYRNEVLLWQNQCASMLGMLVNY